MKNMLVFLDIACAILCLINLILFKHDGDLVNQFIWGMYTLVIGLKLILDIDY